MAQGWQLGAGPDAAEHPAWPLRCAVRVRGLAGDPRRGLGQLGDPVGDAVLAQRGEIGAEGVGLDRIDADLEVGVVDRPDDVGTGHVQDLVAALELIEVLQRQVVALQHRSHGPVRDHHTLRECGTEVWERRHSGHRAPREDNRPEPTSCRTTTMWSASSAAPRRLQ